MTALPSRMWTAVRRRVRPGDAGQVAGVEAISLGVLIFVVGSLLFANVWGTIDAKLAVDTAAREAARAYVEGLNSQDADSKAVAAANDTLRGYGRSGATVHVQSDGFQRCQKVTVTVSYVMATVTVPLIGGFGGTTVTGSHTEIVDPLRNNVPGAPDSCPF
jgi:Flp pilus assembly protein TadG